MTTYNLTRLLREATLIISQCVDNGETGSAKEVMSKELYAWYQKHKASIDEEELEGIKKRQIAMYGHIIK